MYLVEARAKAASKPARLGRQQPAADLVARGATPGGKWETFPNSHISHHGAACCEVALEWLLAFDFAQLNGGDPLTGPRWMREHSSWGPSAWPIHWCEAVDAKTVDCGVHAAIAHEAFLARGLRAFRAQFIQRYSAEAAGCWRENWSKESVSDHWIDGHSIYHEGNAVLVGKDMVKLWDGSAGWWINPRGNGGYGSLAAVRLEADPAEFPAGFRWGESLIVPGQWTAL